MTNDDSATVFASTALLRRGTLLAGLGVLAFSLSFPATLWSLESFGPWSSVGLRGSLAGALALTALVLARVPRPARHQWAPLAVVATGCAIGFPLLTTFALQTASTAHSAVVIGALPMATAAIATFRTRSWQPPAFWLAAGAGAVVVIVFALTQNHGRPSVADLLLFGALVVCAAGYAEGGSLATAMPGWQVIAWGVVLGLPVNITVAAIALPAETVQPSVKGFFGLIYIAAISQFGGFAVWYRGMALIGVARASQLQLTQPLLTVGWAVLLLGERVSWAVPVTAVVVLVCVVLTQRFGRSPARAQRSEDEQVLPAAAQRRW